MTELIFIYNARSGVTNAFIDWAHKIISPNTYKCNTFWDNAKVIHPPMINNLAYIGLAILLKAPAPDYIKKLNQIIML